MIDSFVDVVFSHIRRQRNCVAHNLARYTTHVNGFLVWMVDVLPQLKVVLLANFGQFFLIICDSLLLQKKKIRCMQIFIEHNKEQYGRVMGTKDGLYLARQLNIEYICVEMDVEFLVYLLSNLSTVNLILELLLIDCKNLMKIFTNCSVAHVYMEAKSCVDRLARLGADLLSDYLFCMIHRLWWKNCWLVIKPPMFATDL